MHLEQIIMVLSSSSSSCSEIAHARKHIKILIYDPFRSVYPTKRNQNPFYLTKFQKLFLLSIKKASSGTRTCEFHSVINLPITRPYKICNKSHQTYMYIPYYSERQNQQILPTYGCHELNIALKLI